MRVCRSLLYFTSLFFIIVGEEKKLCLAVSYPQRLGNYQGKKRSRYSLPSNTRKGCGKGHQTESCCSDRLHLALCQIVIHDVLFSQSIPSPDGKTPRNNPGRYV
ncbi:hypothetical protein ABW19_dt0203982 [Dactylella cylindrospora]|nr:hypothetical protein ABW19_dt0203982 [Dactylella cylindrospora]